ncbi:MAG: metallophosphoesterase [Alphaproteobacteria bacterium]|nr:metallophosphoesterase [Alphaproteobacteria bacterium]
MKLVHISDIHINDEAILGSEPVEHFDWCLDHVKRHHDDAERIVITGDLTHHGYRHNYETLREMLDAAAIDAKLLIGNHDNREHFQSVFADVPKDPNGYVQYTDDTSAGRFLYLDSVENGTHEGHFGADRQEWLRAELDKVKNENIPAFIFLHHNPCPVGVPSADVIGLMDYREFGKILAEYKDHVRHIFFGHCHFPLSGSVAGIPMSAPRSTNHPCTPDMRKQAMGYGGMTPTYDVALIHDDHVVVHSMDFTVEDQHQWLQVEADGWVDEDV